jgi:hypothetical protein
MNPSARLSLLRPVLTQIPRRRHNMVTHSSEPPQGRLEPSKGSPLSDILEYLGEIYFPEHEYNDIYADKNKEAVHEAEQAILTLLDEAIGKDETTDYQREIAQSPEDLIRNRLRADIRQKLGIPEKEPKT